MKRGIWILFGVVAFFGLLWFLTMGQRQHRVEVCIAFQGQRNCATAAGQTPQQALRAASDTACATISSGMTDTIACSQTTPSSVRWVEGGR